MRRKGVGLAAPQIGKGVRLAVVDVTAGKNPEAKILLVNPEIIHAEGEVREEEGCLSIPGFRRYGGYVLVTPQQFDNDGKSAKRGRAETFEMRVREFAGCGRSAVESRSPERHFCFCRT